MSSSERVVPQAAITVTVAKDFEDLIPGFLKNRRTELEGLRTAIAAGDFEQVYRLGHRMKGVGNSYGFEKVTLLGKQLEDGAKSADRTGIEARIAEYADYLARVEVVFE